MECSRHLRDFSAEIEKESRAATLISHPAGFPYRIAQQFAVSLMRITEFGFARASSGVACFLELFGHGGFARRHRAMNMLTAFPLSEIVRRTQMLGHKSLASSLSPQGAFQHFSGASDEPKSQQVAFAHPLHTASPGVQTQKYFLGRREEIRRIWRGRNPRIDASLSGRRSHPRGPSHAHGTS